MISAAAAIIDPKDGGGDGHSVENKASSQSGPPERTKHDPCIEEFVREQHRSKQGDGKLET